jgi:hypothetical protein
MPPLLLLRRHLLHYLLHLLFFCGRWRCDVSSLDDRGVGGFGGGPCASDWLEAQCSCCCFRSIEFGLTGTLSEGQIADDIVL